MTSIDYEKKQKKYVMTSAFFYIFTAIATFVLFFPPIALARLNSLSDSELSTICGHGGISFAIKNVWVYQYTDAYRYIDSTNAGDGYLELGEIEVTDSNYGPWQLNPDDGSTPPTGIFSFDVASIPIASIDDWDPLTNPTQEQKLVIAVNAPYWKTDKVYNIGNFRFGGPPEGVKQLGGFNIGSINTSSFKWLMAPHTSGGGFDFEYDFQMTIDRFTYAYQNTFSSTSHLKLSNISIGYSFSDYAGDDPSDPSTWKTNNNVDIGQFKIGDIFGDALSNIHSTPALFDIGEITLSGTKYDTMAFNLPIQGSIRFENTSYGGTDFGPGAIDGIHAYRLQVFLVP